MTKSKNILLYEICFLILLVTFLFVWEKSKREPVSIYKEKETIIEGYIKEIKEEENILTIIVKAKEKILLKYKIEKKKEKKKYKLGSYIKVKGKIEKIENARNQNVFSYQKYLWSKKIYRRCVVEKILSYKENKKWYYKIKNKIIEKIDTSKNKAYYYTFLLGESSFLEENVKESYRKNGMSHLFAISGMHISLFSILLLKILKRLFRKEEICYFICILFLLFYAFLTGFTPSVLRSTFFFIMTTCKKLLKRNTSNLVLYIFLTCFFLLYNPYYIYHTGFLYSFTISFFLLCYAKRLCKKRKVYDLFILSSLSFFASFPIQINTNFEINIISIFINILMVPLISHIIFPFTLLCFFIPLDPILSLFLFVLEKASLFLSTISLNLIFPKMNAIEIILYYILLIYILSKNRKKKIILLFFIYLYIKPTLYPSFLTMIDVGQGDSFFLKANYKSILIDTGGKRRKTRVVNKGKEIITYLKSKGVRKIDTLFLSHGDMDHMGDALYIVQNFKVKKVIFNKGKENDLEKELIKYLKKKKIEYNKIARQKIKIGKNIFYSLNKKDEKNENEDSLILYTKIRKYNILFMGDASVENEKYILSAYNLPKMDILKIGHHGSKTSSSFSFLKKVEPTYSLISVGKENRYGHPSKKVIESLKKIHSHIYLTSTHGMVEITLKKKLVIRSLMH